VQKAEHARGMQILSMPAGIGVPKHTYCRAYATFSWPALQRDPCRSAREHPAQHNLSTIAVAVEGGKPPPSAALALHSCCDLDRTAHAVPARITADVVEVCLMPYTTASPKTSSATPIIESFITLQKAMIPGTGNNSGWDWQHQCGAATHGGCCGAAACRMQRLHGVKDYRFKALMNNGRRLCMWSTT